MDNQLLQCGALGPGQIDETGGQCFHRPAVHHVSQQGGTCPARIGLLSYPMLFQNDGGLQVQVMETMDHLRQLGVDAALVDTTRQKLDRFDLIHIFAATHGNVKLVEQARASGCRVIMSALLNPALVPRHPLQRKMVDLLARVLGRVSGYTVSTDFDQVRLALSGADHVIALSRWERTALRDVFGVEEGRISVVPNGVSAHFCRGDPASFHAQHALARPFVFCPAQISPWKNQLSLIRALAGSGVTVALAGPCHARDRAYLDQCLSVPHAQVRYLGCMDRLGAAFAGAFAAASVLALPSRAESGPLVALEALAAGKPVVITRFNGLDLSDDAHCVRTVATYDLAAIRSGVMDAVATPPPAAACRAIVAHLSWHHVARALAAIYKVDGRGGTAGAA